MKPITLLSVWIAFVAAVCPVMAAEDDGGYIIREPRRELDEIEAIYAGMPPVKYEPPADRWQRLPRSMKQLEHGTALRIVALGDSIVNDTARSAWVLLLDRQYPQCHVDMVTCVRGSTGCWWYKQPGKIQHYVLAHKPDLVIIGGISQRGDTASIENVIRQIRAGSNAEILLTTGSFGKAGTHYDETSPVTLDAKGDDYRARLQRLADQLQVELLDMRGAWLAYVREAAAAGKPLEDFMRDPIHANPSGEQILGRILARYFAPKHRSRNE